MEKMEKQLYTAGLTPQHIIALYPLAELPDFCSRHFLNPMDAGFHRRIAIKNLCNILDAGDSEKVLSADQQR